MEKPMWFNRMIRVRKLGLLKATWNLRKRAGNLDRVKVVWNLRKTVRNLGRAKAT